MDDEKKGSNAELVARNQDEIYIDEMVQNI